MNKNVKIQMNVPVDGSPYRDKIELTKFESVIPKRNELLQTQHNEKLLEHGIIKPFFGWVTTDETGSVRFYLMTNHSDFRFALEHCLPFQIIFKNFLNEDMVVKFIIEETLTTDSLTLFQKGMMVLENKEIFMTKGKENMVKGGKGIQIDEPSHTLDILSSWIGCSHTTLHRIEYILENLKDESLLHKVEYNEISITKVYKSLREKLVDSKRKKDYLPDKEKQLESFGLGVQESPTDQSGIDIPVQTPKYHFYEEGKYMVVYVDTQFHNTRIRDVKKYTESLKEMNIRDVVYPKYCTLIIQTSPMYLTETLEIVKSWGFNCVDSKTVHFNTEQFKSKYSQKYDEVLLICDKNNVGVQSSRIVNPIETGVVSSDSVLDTIDSMFDDGLTKMGVFIDYRDGWDTYNFIEETNELVRINKRTG